LPVRHLNRAAESAQIKASITWSRSATLTEIP
jgi:hypothetical protein